MKRIILASQSPRRKSLLNQLHLDFEIIKPDIVEKLNPRLKPRGNAEQLSLLKVKNVWDLLKSKNKVMKMRIQDNSNSFVIIAADTFVVMDNEILGKPENEKIARKMLIKLNGHVHSVITGFTIVDTFTRKIITRSVETKVYFRKISLKEISSYIKTGEPMDKAGAYGMQSLGAVFIEKIEGEPFNVVGLPLNALSEELKKFGIKIF